MIKDNQKNIKVSNIPVVIFALSERTLSICIESFERLGFSNIIVLDKKEGFSKKMKDFCLLTKDTSLKDSKLFIRSDADRIAMPGMIEFCKNTIEYYENNENGHDFLISEGKGYEYFMKKLRGATPHIYSRETMEYCLKNSNELIMNIPKPESHIGYYFRDKYPGSLKVFDCLTNIHEYGQFPSKMYQAFLNRVLRGHISYYNLKVLFDDDLYGYPMKKAIKDAREIPELKSKGMDYHDFSKNDPKLAHLDEKFMESKLIDLDAVWDSYKSINI